MAVRRAVRPWALTPPHANAHTHGSPGPGDVAPEETAAAAARDGIVLAGTLRDATEAGVLAPRLTGFPPPPESFAPDGARRRATHFAPQSDEVILAALMAWTHIYGTISFELYGMYRNVLDTPADTFDHTALVQAHLLGLSHD
jgi:hypothetical protein